MHRYLIKIMIRKQLTNEAMVPFNLVARSLDSLGEGRDNKMSVIQKQPQDNAFKNKV